MNNFQQYDEDLVPEGLEFNESYMEQAFAMYDAEKESRKRRLLFWWFSASGVFIVVAALTVVAYFGGSEERTTQKTKTIARSVHVADGKKTNRSTAPSNSAGQTVFRNTQKTMVPERNSSFGLRDNSVTAFLFPSKSNSNGKTEIKSQPVLPESSVNRNYPVKTTGKSRVNKLLNGLRAESKKTVATVELSIDSTAVQQLALRCDSIKKQRLDSLKMKHYLYLSMGGNLLFGLSDLTGGLHVRETFGLGYNYSFSRRFYTGLAVEYHSVSRIDYNRYVGASYENNPTQTYTLKTTLNYISITPSIGMKLNDRNRLTLGFGMDYLLPDAEQRLSTRELAVDKNTVNKYSGEDYYNVFRRFNYGVSLGYQLRLTRFVDLSMSYTCGLTDITKNTYSNEAVNRNSRLQLALRFRMF